MAAVAPFLHAQAAFVNLRGQYSIPPGAPRLDALFARHGGKVRALGRHLRLREEGKPRDEVVEAYDATFLRYGYRIDASDCYAIDWQPDDEDALSLPIAKQHAQEQVDALRDLRGRLKVIVNPPRPARRSRSCARRGERVPRGREMWFAWEQDRAARARTPSVR